jgi:hypothetical protein
MNLFILDYDHDKNAEYHIDKHVSKMQLEAAQMLATTIWIDKLLGYVPRKLDSAELGVIKAEMATLPPIDERQFLRYKAAHINHPCTCWMRESYDNFEWAQVYVNSLNEEAQYRGYKPHASCVEVNRMPLPTRLPSKGLTPFAQAMPDDYKQQDTVEAYRIYYRCDKASIASWKNRSLPYWWEI